LQLAESLVHTLRQHPAAHAFNQPVDPEALRIPDYFTVRKRRRKELILKYLYI